jgi:hypothetical protein
MSDFEIDSNKSDSSGKPSGIGSTIFLFLFSLPFAGVGLFALVQGIRELIAGKSHDGLPLCIVGLVFSLAGFGLMSVAVWGRKKLQKDAELKARFADKPWMMRDDWADGKIKSSASGQLIIYLVFAAAFCGIGGLGTALAVPDALHKHQYGGLMVLLFPAVGIGFLIAFINVWRSQRRFGKCFFELAQTPIPLGGTLDGMIQTGKPLKLEHELNLKISCVRQVTTGSGKNRSTNEYILWQEEKIYSSQANLPEPEPGHTGIPVHFKLPDNQPESIADSGDGIHWRLEVKSKMRGPGFHAIFDLPVFKIAGAEISDSSVTEADDSDPTAALAAPIEEIRREENSKIKIFEGPNGREFYFPPGRNAGTALFVTLAMFLFNGIAIGTFYLHTLIIFPIVFGLFGILMILGSFRMWTESIRIAIDSTDVRVKKHWVIFSRTRKFSANDVSRFTTRAGMQSGAKVFLDIRLIPRDSDEKFTANTERLHQTFQDTFQETSLPTAEKVVEHFREASGPRGVTVANNIASAAEANWLVEEMNKALRQTQPVAGYSQSEVMGGPKAVTSPVKIGIAILASFILACGIGYWFWRQANSVSATPQPVESPKTVETSKAAAQKSTRPQPAALTVAFSSFGSGGECATNGLTVESGDGHADWFVSETSGQLYAVELKIEPASEPTKRLIVSIAQDENGVPGAALETFFVARLISTNTLGWLNLNSRQQPTLKAGTKYWIDARSPGAWYWHFNNQNIVQNSMRPARRKWISAGYSNVCAFSVLVETNQPSPR